MRAHWYGWIERYSISGGDDGQVELKLHHSSSLWSPSLSRLEQNRVVNVCRIPLVNRRVRGLLRIVVANYCHGRFPHLCSSSSTRSPNFPSSERYRCCTWILQRLCDMDCFLHGINVAGSTNGENVCTKLVQAAGFSEESRISSIRCEYDPPRHSRSIWVVLLLSRHYNSKLFEWNGRLFALFGVFDPDSGSFCRGRYFVLRPPGISISQPPRVPDSSCASYSFVCTVFVRSRCPCTILSAFGDLWNNQPSVQHRLAASLGWIPNVTSCHDMWSPFRDCVLFHSICQLNNRLCEDIFERRGLGDGTIPIPFAANFDSAVVLDVEDRPGTASKVWWRSIQWTRKERVGFLLDSSICYVQSACFLPLRSVNHQSL